MNKKATSIIVIFFYLLLVTVGLTFAEANFEIEQIDPSISGQYRNTEYLPLEPGVISSLTSMMTSEQLAQVQEFGEVSYYYKDGLLVSLAPPSIDREKLYESLNAIEPTIGVESVFVIPLKEAVSQSEENLFLRLFNLMHQFRTMEGIEYYSASRERMRIFYIVSHLVRDENSHEPLPDPTFSAVEDNQVLTLFQEDASFGENFYKLDIEAKENSLSLTMTNINNINYGIIRVAEPGQLQIHLSVELIDETLIFYGNIAVDALKFLGIEDRAKQSFYNRIVALFNWYVSRLRTEDLIEF